MTWGQWLLEYHGLRKREKDEADMNLETFKAASTVLHETLVNVLGLNRFVKKQQAEASKDGPRPFMPAAYVMGNHHLLKALMDEQEKDENADEVMPEDEFEAFSQKLARGEVGDMDPIMLGQWPPPGAVQLPDPSTPPPLPTEPKHG